MEAKRRRQVLVGALALFLAVLVGYELLSGPAGPPRAASNGVRAGAARRPGSTAAPEAVPGIRLKALAEARPEPLAGGRNLFQFGSAPARPTGAPGGGGGLAPPAPPGLRPGLPTPGGARPAAAPAPPIPLKFIGIVDAPGRTGRIAVLSDGRGVFHGREGDIIEGRYRILHIGVESIEMAYLDGTGRQMIRLTGGGV